MDPGTSPSTSPRHESLEAVFFAAVPPRRAPWLRRAAYGLLPRLLAFAPLRALLLNRKRS
jgi:hypothetical protein